jgi:hypothetical protein
MHTNPTTPITGGQEQNEKIYIINRHFWTDGTPKQVVARTAKTEDEANKIISEYRQENKKLLAEARYKGDKYLEDVYFNTTFSISYQPNN